MLDGESASQALYESVYGPDSHELSLVGELQYTKELLAYACHVLERRGLLRQIGKGCGRHSSPTHLALRRYWAGIRGEAALLESEMDRRLRVQGMAEVAVD